MRRQISLLLVCCLLLLQLQFTVNAVENEQSENWTNVATTTPSAIMPFNLPIHSGTVGTAAWGLYDCGIVIVQGGTVHGHAVASHWIDYADYITKIIFEDEITTAANMRHFFADLINLEIIEGLDNFNTSGTTNMGEMFTGTSSLISVEGLSTWNVSNVTNMHRMFEGASSLTNIDLSGWNTENVRFMSRMFDDTSSLESIKGISNWNTGSVIQMNLMFNNASSLTSLDLAAWDTSSVTNMFSMFMGASALKWVGNLSGWDTGLVTNTASMFSGTDSLVALNLAGWNTENVIHMSRMFYNATSLTCVGDLSAWNTGNVITTLRMFENTSSLEELNLSGWDTSSITTMYRMFAGASTLTCVGDISNWNTGNVTSMGRMFYNAINLTSLNLSGWDTRHSVAKLEMFFGAIGLRELTLGENFLFRTNAALHAVPNNGYFTGSWQNVGSGNVNVPLGINTFTSTELMAQPNGQTMADTWVWQRTPFWGINLPGDHTFTGATVGYGVQTVHDVDVINTGNRPTGELTITLSGSNPDSFTISQNSLSSIATGSMGSFTVVPNTGLGQGTYTARITVTGENGISEYFYVSFTVSASIQPSPAPTPSPSESPGATPSPMPSESPAPTSSPVPSESPAPTPIPVPSGSPLPTPSPVPSGSSPPTPSPVPSGSPSPTPSPLPTVIPSPGVVISEATGSSSENRPPRPSPLSTTTPSPTPSSSPPVLTHRWYIRGYPEGDVRPNGFMTRAEMAAMFFNLSESPDKLTAFYNAGFSDVNPEDWHFRAINYSAIRHNALSGFPDGNFRPNQHITNAEFAAFATGFFNLRQLAPRAEFAGQFDHWAADFIAYSFDELWFDYFGHDYVFLPDAPIPRAIAVTLINHYMGRVPNPDSIHRALQGRLIFNDITSQNHWAFYEIMEAAVAHDFYRDENGLEVWTRIFLPVGE